MNENNFNVCNRCGSANPLSARYCYQCGFELKNPEEPVVCTKCNTVNQGTSNFCKRCGSKLPKAQSKILCPQCSASNNAGTPYCANCGYDFTTQSLPSSVAVAQQLNRQEQIAASTSVVVTKTQEPKLSRKEKKKLKREEEERAYREQMQAKKQAKIDKKEAKKAAKQEAKDAKKQPPQQPQVMQPQIAQYPAVVAGQPMQQVQYMPPVVQQIVVEQPKPQKPKKHRIKNLIVFIIALVGLYFILLPQQFNLLGDMGALMFYNLGDESIALTGWHLIMAIFANFIPALTDLSTVASTYQLTSIEALISGVLLAAVVVKLVLCILAKLLGIVTGKAHKGVDVGSVAFTLVTGGAFAFLYFYGISTLTASLYMLVVPAVFLLIAIFNSKIRKD